MFTLNFLDRTGLRKDGNHDGNGQGRKGGGGIVLEESVTYQYWVRPSFGVRHRTSVGGIPRNDGMHVDSQPLPMGST